MRPEIDYPAIQQRVDAKVKKEMRLAKFVLFAVNLGLFVVFIFMAWQLYLSNGGEPPIWEQFVNIPGIARSAGNPTTGALVMLTVGWGIGLLFQLISLIFDTRLGERQTRERLMGREVNKELARLGLEPSTDQQEKSKHMMRLSDDGELEELVTDDDLLELEAKHQTNG
ncbi:MAG: hypothetical protein R3E39_15650 [Anaerolineae bacterium]